MKFDVYGYTYTWVAFFSAKMERDREEDEKNGFVTK